jgi:hypothetical protein
MKKIYQLFNHFEDLSKKIGFNLYQFPNKLCWFPNAELDFSPIALFETFTNEKFKINEKPSIYIYSNLYTEHLTPLNQNCPFWAGQILYSDVYRKDERSIVVKECHEINLKKEIYSPFSTIIDSIPFQYEKDRFSGNTYFLLLNLNFVHQFKRITVEIPLFYFTYENLNLLLDLFLKYQLKINHFIYFKNSNKKAVNEISLKTIYTLQNALKINHILSDKSLQSMESRDIGFLPTEKLLQLHSNRKPYFSSLINTDIYNAKILADLFNNNWAESIIRPENKSDSHYFKWSKKIHQ